MKTHYSFKKSACFGASIAVLAASSSCYWDESLYDEFVGDQGYLVTCRGRCLGEEIVSKEDCKGDDRQWIEQVKENSSSTGGDDHSDKTENPGEGSENPSDSGAAKTPLKSGYCLIQSKLACEGLRDKRDNYKSLEWKDLDFQMLDLGNGEYGRFIPKGSYNPQSTPDEREKMEGVYVCGTFDEVKILNEEEASKHPCDAVRIEKIKRSFKGTSCPLVSNKCGYIESFKNKVKTEDGKEESALSFNQPSGGAQAIGFCSKCDPNQVMCGNECADLSTSTKHCGKCGNVCGESEYCDGEKCQEQLSIECIAPTIACMGEDGTATCLDRTDVQKCGATCSTDGQKCKKNESCIEENSKFNCVCESHIFDKNGECVNPASLETCGATSDNIRGTQCASNEACVFHKESKSYACLCPSGIVIEEVYKPTENSEVITKRICVDPSSDAYCGATEENKEGTPCYNGTYCIKYDDSSYRCTCPSSWQKACYNEKNEVSCLDVVSDTKYCGLTNCDELTPTLQKCNSNMQCVSGVCVCENNMAYCDNECINGNMSLLHCGAKGQCSDDEESENYKGKECSSNEYCKDGVCTCKAGTLECDGICVDPSHNEYCGMTDSCSSGENCTEKGLVCRRSGGRYSCQCPNPEDILCEGVCINPNLSGTHCGARGLCNNSDSSSFDYAGDNCGKKQQVCLFDEKTNAYTCQSSCPSNLVNCNGECVDPVLYNITTDCTSCITSVCYTGEVNEAGEPIEFDYKKCAVLNPDGSKVTIQNGDAQVLANAKNSPLYCNGCFPKPYDEVVDESEAVICPNHAHCTDRVGTGKFYGCKCDEGMLECSVASDANTGLQKTICLDAEKVHMVDCNTCEPGWLDNNNDLSDGCELDITTPSHCGAPDNNCNRTVQNAFGPTCTDGACSYAGCLADFGDCDDDPTNGCETTGLKESMEHCGGCNRKCQASACEDSICCWKEQKEIGKTEPCCNGYKKYKYTSGIWCWGSTEYRCAKEKPNSIVDSCWKEVEE